MNKISTGINKSIPIYKQIIASIEESISNGELKTGDQLPSLNALKSKYQISRDTVLTAFSELKNRGIINSTVGKGYYVVNDNIRIQSKVFLLLDELNAIKEDLYRALIRYLGSEVQIDVFFHHYDQQLFVDIIKRNLDTYNYYVIMPANLRDIEACIDLLEDDKVYILDQLRPELSKYSAVYQDYENDIYKALRLLQPKIERYKNFKLIYSSKKQPVGILKGFKHFCESQNIRHHVLPDFNENLIFEKDLFLVLNDRHLKLLIKSMKEKGFELARDYGIISFNETVLKEITAGGITTISTDFKQMGKQLSEMILQHKEGQIANISRVKERSSL